MNPSSSYKGDVLKAAKLFLLYYNKSVEQVNSKAGLIDSTKKFDVKRQEFQDMFGKKFV